jgi:hypothetical protein
MKPALAVKPKVEEQVPRARQKVRASRCWNVPRVFGSRGRREPRIAAGTRVRKGGEVVRGKGRPVCARRGWRRHRRKMLRERRRAAIAVIASVSLVTILLTPLGENSRGGESKKLAQG